jgi:hypothetical protein
MTTRFSQRTDGVSVVVGALLILALIVATTVTIRLSYVPVWQADKEAAQMSEVQKQFAAIKAGLDRQADTDDFVPQSYPVSLGSSSTSIMGGTPPPGALRFDPDVASFRLFSSKLNVQIENGTSYIGADETWTTIGEAPASTTIANVGRVLSLRLQLNSIDEDNVNDAVTVTITDSNGAFAGSFRVMIDDLGGNDWAINYRTQRAGPSTIFETDEARPDGATLAPLYVEATQANYRFASLLSVASSPYTLTFQASDVSGLLTAQYAITYEEVGVGGTALRGGTGLVRTDYIHTETSGRLTFDGATSYFPQQTYHAEHGAILLSQADGDAMVVDPSFEAHAVGTTTVLSLAMPAMIGDGAHFSSRATVGVQSTPISRTSWTAEAPNFSLNISTSLPSVWENYFDATLAALPGFVDGTHWTVQTGSNWANLTVYGTTAAPNSSAYDLSVQVKYVIARVEVES